MALRSSIAGLLVFAVLLGLQCLQADQLERQPLFKIERNKNANIVQYDAQIEPDGKLNRKKPVDVYWIRLAEDGQVEKLSWLQKTFVYGFKARLDRKTNRLALDMNSDLSPPIRVEHVDGTYQAMVEINGRESRLEKFFIHSTGDGLSTRLDYIEIYGTDLQTGDPIHQQIEP